jgi:hypothetical protein
VPMFLNVGLIWPYFKKVRKGDGQKVQTKSSDKGKKYADPDAFRKMQQYKSFSHWANAAHV